MPACGARPTRPTLAHSAEARAARIARGAARIALIARIARIALIGGGFNNSKHWVFLRTHFACFLPLSQRTLRCLGFSLDWVFFDALQKPTRSAENTGGCTARRVRARVRTHGRRVHTSFGAF